MVHSELKRLMLLVVLMLLVGGISSGVVLSQEEAEGCLLYTSPSPRDLSTSRMPSSA